MNFVKIGNGNMFPSFLDGAKVLFYTLLDYYGDIDKGFSGYKVPIRYLAICKYEEKNRFYLFFHTFSFEVEHDYLFDTIEECKDEAYKLKNDIVWIEK